MVTTVKLAVTGPYSLAQSRAFLHGFIPASGSTIADANDARSLALAFRLDGSLAPIGVVVREDEGRAVAIDVHSGDVDVAIAATAGSQVARMLGLDVDATAWSPKGVGKTDPVLGALLQEHDGFRPVAFASPWEAGVWGLLAHRINMKQAAAIKRKVAEQHGDSVTITTSQGGDQRIALFPSPTQVLALPKAPAGVPEEKWLRIGSLAQAAQRGELDVAKLRAMSPEQAHAHLGKLRGVGAWTAGHIHIRGAATVDVVSLDEPRVRRAVQHAYGLEREPTDAEMLKISEGWRPFRTWAMVLLAMHLNRSGKWNDGAGTRARRARTRGPRGRGRQNA